MGGSASPSNDKIKMRAFAIWEEEGRPDGKHLEHWERAEREIANGANGAQPPQGAPAPAAARRRPAKGKGAK